MSKTYNCVSCKAPLEENLVICRVCQALQPIYSEVSPFRYFGFDPQFDLDELKLEREYLDLQVVVHPDKQAKRSAEECEYAKSHAIKVTQAYETLKDPIKRAQALMHLKGIELNLETHIQDPELLQQTLERQESLSNLSSKAAIKAFIDESEVAEAIVMQELSQAFRESNFDAVPERVAALRYAQKLYRDARMKLMHLTS